VLRLLAIAAALTLLNVVKPVVVDDTAYLFFARHVSQNPLDPYGFTLFWYYVPDPAMEVLLPPVLPYWLGLGIALFGENVYLLKLWLFPLALLLTWSVRGLLQRFAPRTADASLPLIALSAFILPLFSCMLDVPALAFGLAALHCFLNAVEQRRIGWSLASGVLLALALQTKYSMLTIPLTIFAATILYGGWRHLFIVAGISALLCISWEYWLFSKYGRSHFLLHAQEQSATSDWWANKLMLIPPSLTYIGLLTGGWGLYAGVSTGFPRWLVYSVAGYGVLGTLAVVFVPMNQLLPNLQVNLPNVVFAPLGIGLLVTLLLASLRFFFRCPSGRFRWNRHSLFLVGWLLWEGIAYFLLTPFPAGRRVMTFSLVAALVACRMVSLGRRPASIWMSGYLLFTGFGLFALDAWDALPERELARQAAAVAKPEPGGQYWTQGHWGWQYYTDREGMKLVVPGKTLLRAGDVLVLPREPDPYGFYRPYHGGANFNIVEENLELLKDLTWEDVVVGQTIPTLYGGYYPITQRDQPRLRVQVYRVKRDWLPER
jgi:4-amino-4-deoxy-L-arabinose transferase-like glycosyltransferase